MSTYIVDINDILSYYKVTDSYLSSLYQLFIMVTYCPHKGCGAEVYYTGVKPSVCPKCRQSFAAAFAHTYISESNEAEAPKPTHSIKKKTSLFKRNRPSRFADEPATASTFMNPPPDMVSEVVTPEEEQDDESATSEEIALRAEEIKASINKDDIQVIMSEEGPTKFRWFGPKI